MDTNTFINIDSSGELQNISVADYPHFAAVLAKMNAKNTPLHSVISQYPGNSLQERLFNALNNNLVIKTCACGNNVNFLRIKAGYTNFCSAKCREANPLTQLKREATNIERFGVKNAGQSAIKKQKIRKTNTDRTGFPSSLSNTALKQANMLKKYGVQHAVQHPEISARIKETCLKRYGAESYLFTDEFKERAKFTLKEKYGVDHNSQIEEVKKKKSEQLYSFRKVSKFELEVVAFIKSLVPDLEVLTNCRSIINPQELDIVIPSLKIAIECDGCYWHSDPWKDKDYHLKKTQACEMLGYKLIHLFDIEWTEKRNIVESRLKNLLGISKIIYARKCTLEKVSSADATIFLKEHHIQGSCIASINISLKLDGKIVAIMTFGKPRYNSTYDYELLRYCSSGTVVGGASRLLKFFKDLMPGKNIISYADRRWSTGKIYQTLGFTQIRESAPCYWYFKNNKLFHRSVFQKHKLNKLLENFDPSKTEVQNMYDNGWRRVFDCGTKVFTLSPS